MPLEAHTLLLIFLCLLANRARVVLAGFSEIAYSNVKECENFKVKFGKPTGPVALPLSLTVVPIETQTPLFIPIPNSLFDQTTLSGQISLVLPLPFNTLFVASLDDANGVSAGPISDIIKVRPSGSSLCLPPNVNDTNSTVKPFFSVGKLTQCQPFSFQYNQTEIQQTPKVRAFIPAHRSFHVHRSNTTSPSPSSSSHEAEPEKKDSPLKVIQFNADAYRGDEVVLMIDFGAGPGLTSKLITVTGDTTSRSDCIPGVSRVAKPAEPQIKPPKGLSKKVRIIIGIVTAVVVGIVAMAMSIVMYRREKRRFKRTQESLSSQGQSSETKSIIFSSFVTYSPPPTSFGISDLYPHPDEKGSHRDSKSDAAESTWRSSYVYRVDHNPPLFDSRPTTPSYSVHSISSNASNLLLRPINAASTPASRISHTIRPRSTLSLGNKSSSKSLKQRASNASNFTQHPWSNSLSPSPYP